MKTKSTASLALLAVILLGAALYGWRTYDAPRRASLSCLAKLDGALQSGDRATLIDFVIIPAAVRNRAVAEQSEFLAKALNDELSGDGLTALRQRGTFGPLRELFPMEADNWAGQAGVQPEDCVAFKLEHQGRRAEVVLANPRSRGERYRVVRVNNVKQLAALNVQSPEKPQ